MSEKLNVGSALKKAFPLAGKIFFPYLLNVIAVGALIVGLFFLARLDMMATLTGSGEEFFSKLWSILGIYLVAVLGFHLVGLHTTAMSLTAARQGTVSWKLSLTQALGRFFPVMGSYLLLVLIFIGGILVFALGAALVSLLGPIGQILMVLAVIALYVGLFVVMLGLTFLVPVHLEKQPGVWEAVKQTWALTQGRKGRLFGFYLVAMLVVIVLAAAYLISLIIPIVTGEIPDPTMVLGYVLTMMVVGIFIGPYLTAGTTLFYLEATSDVPAADLEKMVGSFEEASKPVDRTDA